MAIHETVIVWTARCAVLCMLARLVITMRSGGGIPLRSECLVWTTGWLVFLLHVWAAFQFRHDWSHADALRHTAKQTASVIGWNWGGGLYFNYVFTVLWGVDVAADWRAYGFRRVRCSVWQIALRWFLAFMAVNATLVFGHPGWWVIAVLLALLLLIRRGGWPGGIVAD